MAVNVLILDVNEEDTASTQSDGDLGYNNGGRITIDRNWELEVAELAIEDIERDRYVWVTLNRGHLQKLYDAIGTILDPPRQNSQTTS